MAGSKALSWTVSKGGRRALRGATGCVIGGTFLAHYLPHTWMLDTTERVTQAYRKGISIPVAPSVTQLVEEVMDDMGFGEEERMRVKLYTPVGFDLFSAGSVASRHGAILGVPSNLKWESLEEFDPKGVVVNNAPVPWSSPDGERLKNYLVMSREAKKFVIARELYGIASNTPIGQAFVPAAALTLAYTTALGINRRLNLYAKPRSLRACLYTLTALFGYGVYILGTDMGTVKREADGDEAVGKLGKAYARGGVEFYESVLLRNVALRALMGKDGEGLFTALGNDEVLFRTRHLPYTMRRDYMKKQLQKYTEGASEGETDGATEGKKDGPSEGETDGTSEGKKDGPSEGETDGTSEGKTDGPSEGEIDGTSEGKPESEGQKAEKR